ncbi:hypothetical protein CEE55_03135 [Stenotrophomonas pavanii]|uniref:Uncharacterized protein n=2 Tax=Stenotrophomonas pavanii TaxID=487698 RepID=A0A246L2T6_9GAMM|nr:hypothetical protein CEE55_03135 [Stenotrophomonas pavanii]
MGAYHGRAGFDAMSKRLPVLWQSRWPATVGLADVHGVAGQRPALPVGAHLGWHACQAHPGRMPA